MMKDWCAQNNRFVNPRSLATLSHAPSGNYNPGIVQWWDRASIQVTRQQGRLINVLIDPKSGPCTSKKQIKSHYESDNVGHSLNLNKTGTDKDRKKHVLESPTRPWKSRGEGMYKTNWNKQILNAKTDGKLHFPEMENFIFLSFEDAFFLYCYWLIQLNYNYEVSHLWNEWKHIHSGRVNCDTHMEWCNQDDERLQ